MELDKKRIANTIKNARIQAKFTQSQLAEKVGLSEKHVSKIETGKNIPSLDKFLNIVQVLNLTLGDFGLNEVPHTYESKQYLQSIINSSSEKQLDTYADIIQTLTKHV